MGEPLVSYCWIDTPERDDAIACAQDIANDTGVLIAPICRTCIPTSDGQQPANLSASAQ
jgi:hypothetical protein